METTSDPTMTSPAVFRSARGRNLQLVAERQTAAPTPDVAAREAALASKEAELQAALATIRAAFAILGSRALVMLALIASIGAFGWAIYVPDALRLSGACLLTVLTFLPALWMDRRTP